MGRELPCAERRAPIHRPNADGHGSAGHRAADWRGVRGGRRRGPKHPRGAGRSTEPDWRRRHDASVLDRHSPPLIEVPMQRILRDLILPLVLAVAFTGCGDGSVTTLPTTPSSLDAQVRQAMTGWGVVPILPVALG